MKADKLRSKYGRTVKQGSRATAFDWTIYVIAALLGLMLAALLPMSAKAEQLPLGTVAHLAHEAALEHRLYEWSADRLVCIAWYESTFKREARNGQYVGLMQFSPALWASWAPSQGYSASVEAALDPRASMDVAAIIVAHGEWSHWTPVKDGRC